MLEIQEAPVFMETSDGAKGIVNYIFVIDAAIKFKNVLIWRLEIFRPRTESGCSLSFERDWDTLTAVEKGRGF